MKINFKLMAVYLNVISFSEAHFVLPVIPIKIFRFVTNKQEYVDGSVKWSCPQRHTLTVLVC